MWFWRRRIRELEGQVNACRVRLEHTERHLRDVTKAYRKLDARTMELRHFLASLNAQIERKLDADSSLSSYAETQKGEE